jgi:hypothetical protein
VTASLSRGHRPRWEALCLVAILALASWLRFRHLELMEFKLDEANAVRIARNVLHGHLTTVGLTSSVGAKNPPLFVYLTAIPLAVWNDPMAATAFVGVIAVIAVALAYVVLRPRFDAVTALGTAVLLAAAPWAVLYGRKLWAQDLLPIVTVSLLWAIFVVLERERTRAVWLVPLLLSLAVQLNFSALALVVPVAVVLLYRARDVRWPAFFAGLIVSALLLAPWLAHNATHGFHDLSLLARQGHGAAAFPGQGTLEAIGQTVDLFGTGNWRYVAGPSQGLLSSEAGWVWTVARVANLVAFVLFAFGLVATTLRVVRGARRRRGWPLVMLDVGTARRAVLLVWVAGIWVTYAASAGDRVFPHYLIVTYPVSFVLIALALSELVSAANGRERRIVELGSAVVLAALALSFVGFTLRFQQFVGRTGGTAGDYGVVYRDERSLAHAVHSRGLGLDGRFYRLVASVSLRRPFGRHDAVLVRNRLRDGRPLACGGALRAFGPLEACFPAARSLQRAQR